MGLSSSTARGNNFAFPPPVQTRGMFPSALSSWYTTNINHWYLSDELLQRYSHLLAIGPKGISDEGQRCLEAVFNTFCSQSESTKCQWEKAGLKATEADWTKIGLSPI